MLLFLKKLPISQPALRYLIVGATSFVVEYASFYSMYIPLKVPLITANSVSFGLGLLTSFLLNRVWTFGKGAYSKKASHQLLLYITLALINLAISNILIKILDSLEVDPQIGKIIAISTIAFWNYFFYKVVIFKSSSSTD